jgi:hypothetical protein
MLAEAIRASLVVIEAGDRALEKCGRQPFFAPCSSCVFGHGAQRPKTSPALLGQSIISGAARGSRLYTPHYYYTAPVMPLCVPGSPPQGRGGRKRVMLQIWT